MKYFIVFPLLMLLLPFSLGAADFGLLVNQNAGGGNQGNEEAVFDYQADILPRLFFLLGDKNELFLSAGFTLGVADDFYYVPELLRTDFFWHSGSAGIRVGRMHYTDPLTFIANGLFDGARFSYHSRAGTLGIGAWYTGLLYKKTANITMTGKEQDSYDAAVDYGKFLDTYFAPRRLLASMDWEHPSIGETLNLKAAITGQVDFSDGNEKYHSQYLILKAALPVKSFLFELGGSFEAAEFEPAADDKNFNIAFAWDVGIFWTLPTIFNSRLSLSGHFAGGGTDGIVGAFVPITTKYYGDVFKPKLSGLTVLALDYTARLGNTLGTSLAVSYFVRNDLETYKDYPISSEDKDGYFLGTELFARFIWSPVSDIQLNLGGGVFLPVLGNAGPDEKPRWRVELAAILSLY